jgi:hypothetical protein
MADSAPQIWDIILTPAQRWALVQLAFHQEAPKITDAAGGKKLRRALRAFGLMEIRDVLKEHDKISSLQAASSTPALHKITAENLECVLGWATVPRQTAIELDAGEVFDLLEDIKGSPASYEAPSSVAPFDAAAETWAPPPEPEEPSAVTCPSCKQTFELAELVPPAAEVVSRPAA